MVVMLGHHGCSRLLPLVLLVASTGSVFAQRVENVRKRALQDSDVAQHGSTNKMTKSEDETYWERYLQVADSLPTAAPVPAPTLPPVPPPSLAPVPVPTDAPVAPPTVIPVPPTMMPVPQTAAPTTAALPVPTGAPVPPTMMPVMSPPTMMPVMTPPTMMPVMTPPTMMPVISPTCPVSVNLTCVYGPNSLPCETLTTTPNATNCTVDVLLEIDSCNVGMEAIVPSTIRLDVNGTGPSGVDVQFLPGEPVGPLGPNECYKAAATSAFDVCIVSQYYMVATVGVNTTSNVPLCEAQDTLNLSIAPAGSPVPMPTMPMPTMMPAPATMMPVPATMMPVPATMMPVPTTMMPVPATMMPVPATMMPVPATMMPVAPVVAPTLAPVAPSIPGSTCPLNVDVTCVYGPNNLPCETLTTTPGAANCEQDVLININACNAGTENIAPASLRLDVNGTSMNPVNVEFLPGPPASILGPTECYLASAKSAFDVCTANQYLIVATVGAATGGAVPLCNATDSLTVNIAPAGGPVPAPTMPMPSMMPVNILPPPSSPVAPVVAPVAQPTLPPNGQTVAPALQGTGCIDLTLGCVYGPNRAGCDTIVGESQFNCTCGDCARELVFTYTAASCNGLAGCQDLAPLTSQAHVMISAGASDVLFSGNVSSAAGSIKVSRVDGSCLPASLSVEVKDVTSTTVLQTLTINSACTATGGGPVLMTGYGSLAFQGYSCSATDVHNCLLDVNYEATSCNIDTIRLVFDTLNFSIDGTGPSSVESEVQPNPTMFLNPSECTTTTIIAGLQTCMTSTFDATATVGYRPSTGGAVCTDQSQLNLAWQV